MKARLHCQTHSQAAIELASRDSGGAIPQFSEMADPEGDRLFLHQRYRLLVDGLDKVIIVKNQNIMTANNSQKRHSHIL